MSAGGNHQSAKACLRCDHWARWIGSAWGACDNPASPQYHARHGACAPGQHLLMVNALGTCAHHKAIPEAEGLDKRSRVDG